MTSIYDAPRKQSSSTITSAVWTTTYDTNVKPTFAQHPHTTTSITVCGGAQVFTEYVNNVEKQSYVYASYVDDPVALITANGDTSFYHQNHLFSTEVMTDSAGAIIETSDYDSYGKVTLKDNLGNIITASSVGNKYYFTGRRLDSESGLYYFRNRYFDVELGRFISRDPFVISPNITLLGSYFRIDPRTSFVRSLNRGSNWGPIATDGYRDGLSLYRGYFHANFLDPMGEKCEYRTSNPNPDAPRPVPNGCGSGATEALVPDGFVFFTGWWGMYVNFSNSCDVHDVCYGTCGLSKYDCDVNLETLIVVACHEAIEDSNLWDWQKKMVIQQCNGVAASYRYAVQEFGGEPYESAQDEVCEWKECDCEDYDKFEELGVRVRRDSGE